jgi:hypothetical protein
MVVIIEISSRLSFTLSVVNEIGSSPHPRKNGDGHKE